MINSTIYFAILYALVALWAVAIIVLVVRGVRRRRVPLVVSAIAIAWAGPAAMFWLEAMLSG